MNVSAPVFDRHLLAWRRARAARLPEHVDFLLREAALGLAERIATVIRRFPLAVDLGAGPGTLGAVLVPTGKVDTVIATESAPALLGKLPAPKLGCDEEALPFADESLDLVVSALALQWVNDLPGCLVQVRRALRPDGLFLAAMLGGASLAELRQALMDAEIEATGGASPRVAPFVDVREAGALLQRAGFALPVVDADVLTVRYDSMLELMRDLRRMGWANALVARSRTPLRRAVLARAAALYAERHGDGDGRVRATFEIVNLSGWAPHESQQKPLRPGSARMRLADALGTREVSAGAKARPGKDQ